MLFPSRARCEAKRNQEELKQLRQRWAAEQVSREALLQETGEAERSLAVRERACGEALARQIQAELQGVKPESHGLEKASQAAILRLFKKLIKRLLLAFKVQIWALWWSEKRMWGACERSAMRPRP